MDAIGRIVLTDISANRSLWTHVHHHTDRDPGTAARRLPGDFDPWLLWSVERPPEHRGRSASLSSPSALARSSATAITPTSRTTDMALTEAGGGRQRPLRRPRDRTDPARLDGRRALRRHDAPLLPAPGRRAARCDRDGLPGRAHRGGPPACPPARAVRGRAIDHDLRARTPLAMRWRCGGPGSRPCTWADGRPRPRARPPRTLDRTWRATPSRRFPTRPQALSGPCSPPIATNASPAHA